MTQTTQKDLREHGRIILAHGEQSGHMHHVVTDVEAPPSMDRAQYFEEPDGTKMLLVLGDDPLYLRHDEHARLTLDPTKPVQLRQGDVLLTPAGPGAWKVTRQSEYLPAGWQVVAD
jgi:hypothetical protein